MFMVIYKITNLINGKIYIGQDSKNNPTYFGSGKKIKSAITKYGKQNFKKEILQECSSTEELNNQEVYWINYHNSTDRKIGYNISTGGKEGDREKGLEIVKNGIYNFWVKKYGEEIANQKKADQFEKLSTTNKKKGTELTKRGRYQIWLEKYGKNEADLRLKKWKDKISEYQQSKLKNGWVHTKEALEKIRKASLDRKHSEETKNKLRKPKDIINCPYCDKSGGVGVMSKWHFENCKYKINE